MTASEPLTVPESPFRNQHTFDSERAKLAGMKSGERRRQKPIKFPLPPEPSEAAKQEAIRTAQLAEELELVSEQITLTREVLNDKSWAYCDECKRAGVEPHHRAQLIRALDTLLDRRRELRGWPRQGTLKPTAPRSTRQSRSGSNSMPEPTPISE